MRRCMGFILALVLLTAVGFYFLPAATRESLSQFVFAGLQTNDDSKSREGWPLLAIDAGVVDGDSPHAQWRPVHLEPAPAVPLEQALSFQMTIPQILGNWPQVSTGIKEDGLFGYRVPLVTGMEESDVTGALTYFFGSNQVLYRIEFTGDTGDARKLIAHLSHGFQMQRRRSAEQGVFLYQTSEEEPIVGELRVSPRTIIHTTRPHQRFEISLQLSRFDFD